MRERPRLRTWLSPLLGLGFLTVGLSGLALLVGGAPHALREAHEWLGVFFVGAAVVHLVLNRRALLAGLGSRGAVAAVLVGAAAVASLVLFVPRSAEGRGGHGSRARDGSERAAVPGSHRGGPRRHRTPRTGRRGAGARSGE
jgi:hypothetical protein